MQTFRIGNIWILLAKVVAWGSTVLAPFLVLGLYLALTKPIVERLKTTQLAILFEIGLFLTTALITIFGAWYCFRYLRDFSFRSVTVDDDGIWLTHLSKETGLIRWQDIVCIREPNWCYRLDLKDHEGVTRIKLEYELAKFNKLYAIVEKNTRKYIRKPKIPVTFSKSFAYHFFYILFLVMFSILGLLVAETNLIALLMLLAFVIIPTGYEYLKTPIKVTVNKENLIIRYPLISCICVYSEIISIKKNSNYVLYGVTSKQVEIHIKESRKPHLLTGFGDRDMLYQLIYAAWKGS